MTPKQVMINCTFCGDTQVPRGIEDVFPQWLIKKLAYFAEQYHPGQQASYVNYTYTNLADFQADDMTGDKATSKTPVGKMPKAYMLPDVCVECNNGWMSRLETATIPILMGLVEGKGKLLTPYDQFVLGTWTVKTSLTYDAARSPRMIPAERGSRELFRLGYPLPGAHVGIGWDPYHIPEGVIAHGRRRVNTEDLMSIAGVAYDVHAVHIAFQFDKVILRTMIGYGADLQEHSEWGARLPFDSPRFAQLWPPLERYEWPSVQAAATD